MAALVLAFPFCKSLLAPAVGTRALPRSPVRLPLAAARPALFARGTACSAAIAAAPVAPPPLPAVLLGRLLSLLRALFFRLLVWCRLWRPRRYPVAPWAPLAAVVVGRATRTFAPPPEVYVHYNYMLSPFYATLPARFTGNGTAGAVSAVRWMRAEGDVYDEFDRLRDETCFDILCGLREEEAVSEAEAAAEARAFKWPWET